MRERAFARSLGGGVELDLGVRDALGELDNDGLFWESPEHAVRSDDELPPGVVEELAGDDATEVVGMEVHVTQHVVLAEDDELLSQLRHRDDESTLVLQFSKSRCELVLARSDRIQDAPTGDRHL